LSGETNAKADSPHDFGGRGIVNTQRHATVRECRTPPSQSGTHDVVGGGIACRTVASAGESRLTGKQETAAACAYVRLRGPKSLFLPAVCGL
jgi:hypothetical protein